MDFIRFRFALMRPNSVEVSVPPTDEIGEEEDLGVSDGVGGGLRPSGVDPRRRRRSLVHAGLRGHQRPPADRPSRK